MESRLSGVSHCLNMRSTPQEQRRRLEEISEEDKSALEAYSQGSESLNPGEEVSAGAAKARVFHGWTAPRVTRVTL